MGDIKASLFRLFLCHLYAGVAVVWGLYGLGFRLQPPLPPDVVEAPAPVRDLDRPRVNITIEG